MKETEEALFLEEGITGAEREPTAIAKLEKYLSSKYEFLYNTLMETTLWRLKDTGTDFKKLSDYDLKSMVRELQHLNFKMATQPAVEALLSSDYVTQYNPLHTYLETTAAWDGKTDYIAELAATIQTKKSIGEEKDYWPLYFKKWMVAAVANLYLDGSENDTCLVLCGSQGSGKTYWLDALVPHFLREDYLLTGRVNPEDKDTLIRMASCWLINLDDVLRSIFQKDSEMIKNLITTPRIRVRKSYGRYDSHLRRIASFVASINGRDFLTDPSGSRRFLPFDVVSIDREASNKIDRSKAWRQAFELFKSGFAYKFNQEEIVELNQRNAAFESFTTEYELLVKYFCDGNKPVPAALTQPIWLSRSEIQQYLFEQTKIPIKPGKLSEAIKKLGLQEKQMTIGNERPRVFNVIKLADYQPEAVLQSEQKMDDDLPF